MKFKTTVMGERGQIVIPKEMREALKIKPGAQVIIMMPHGEKGPAIILPAHHIKTMMKKMTMKFQKIQRSLA